MCALLKVLSVLPDPRRGQGLRFELEAVLGLALAAVIAGARPDRGVAEWVADLDEPMRGRFGAARWVPSAATIRRVALGVDPDLLDVVLGAWVGARGSDRATDHELVCFRHGDQRVTTRRVVAAFENRAPRGVWGDGRGRTDAH